MSEELNEKNYREYPAINYSTLSKLDESVKNLKFEKPKESQELSKGSLLDTMLYEPHRVDDLFIVEKYERPTSTLGEILDGLFQNQIYEEHQIEDFVNQKGSDNKYVYWKGYTNLETRKKQWFNSNLLNYLNFLRDSEGKTIVSREDYEDCEEGVSILKTHPFTKNYFREGLQPQVLLKGNLYKDYVYKGKLDHIYKDSNWLTIEPFDLKSSSRPLSEVIRNIFKYRYDLQSSIYNELLRFNFPNYEILDFKIIFYSFVDKLPLVVNMRNYIEQAKVGYHYKFKYYRGWEELSDTLMWHKENNIYDYEKEIYTNNGMIILE